MNAVLWYLHDHGRGHLERARAVIPHLAAEVVVVAGPGVADLAGATLDVDVVDLPTDVPQRAIPTTGPWHHAPAGPTLRRRTARVVDVAERYDCATAVVDVSMEVTVLARLLGLRTVAVRQSGHRTDAAHRNGFASADAVWVPQHRSLEPIDEPIDDRWFFSGPFSRFDHRLGEPSGPRGAAGSAQHHAVILVGTGGTDFDMARWRHAEAPPGWTVTIAGTGECWTTTSVTSVGTIEPIHPLLASADLVVTSAGWAAIADTVAAGARVAIVPERRPFCEQAVRANALHAAGLAVSLPRWPKPDQLGQVIVATEALDMSRWGEVHDGHGAQRAARMIDELHGT